MLPWQKSTTPLSTKARLRGEPWVPAMALPIPVAAAERTMNTATTTAIPAMVSALRSR